MSMSSNNVVSFAAPGDPEAVSDQADLQRLAALIEKYAPHEGRFGLSVGGLHVIKACKPSEEAIHTMAQHGMCIVAQGAKSVSLSHNSYEYDQSRMVVYAAEVPVHSKIVKASQERPYLCLVVDIDPHRLSELILKVFPNGAPKASDARAIYVGQSNPKIVQSAIRMMELILQQEDIDLLVPLVIDEILIRLLRSPSGPAIAQIGVVDSNAQKVGKAITWLKENYAQTIKIDDLAKVAGMSVSAFHTHFKNVTSMSPLQFQKTLRLQEARNMMLIKMMDVSSTSYEVGYSSPSQFSREYSRLFGVSPAKDISNQVNPKA